MKKLQISFALILSLVLVGIFGGSALAYDPFGLKPVQVPGTLNLKVPFKGTAADKEYTVLLKEGSNTLKTYTATTITDKTGFITILNSEKVLTPGKKGYTVELYDSSDLAKKLSTSTAFVDEYANEFDGTEVDKVGSGLDNANQTGLNNTRKQRDKQKVHGFYENNTNSCASCHQTHTGSGDMLLFKNGTYSTCAACHDGTMGAYGVWDEISEKNVKSVSGTFNVNSGNDGAEAAAAKHNGSIHEADGSLSVSAAPGGNRTATTGTWSNEFDCASCHAAHGNGSGSENNLNLNPMGWGTIEHKVNGTNEEKNGKLFKNIKIVASNAIPTTNVGSYILVKFTAVNQTTIDGNYFYKRANVTAGSDIIQTYRWTGEGKKYEADYALWLQEKGYPYKADTRLYNDDYANLSFDWAGKLVPAMADKDIARATGLTVVWRDGFAFGSNVANIKSAQVSVGIDVETTDNVRSLFDAAYETKDGSNVKVANQSYIPNSGIEMSKYCAACHVDYLSRTHTDDTGVYSVTHRHQTDADSTTCVRCHFAHGSEAQIMKDANDLDYYALTKAEVDGGKGKTPDDALAYLKDPNPSSALKRYTGMTSCYACHGKGVEFMSNPNNNPTTDKLLDGGPGEVRKVIK